MSLITRDKFHNQTLFVLPNMPFKNEEFAWATTLTAALYDVVT